MSFNPVEREINDVKRFEEILGVLFEAEFGFVLDHLGMVKHVPLLKRVKQGRKDVPTPERVRQTFEELGPTFIKFGQILAQRPDIIPPAYIEELEKLEDSVPPFDSDTAIEIIEDDIGPIEETFRLFEREPIAAASIAQVHRATLNNGDEVVVKVRRPGIKDQMEQDLDILQFIAKQGEKHSQNLRNMRVHQAVSEFARWTRNELNLKREGRNAQQFQINLRDAKRVKIPDVYMEYTTERVLVMEYVHGVKSNNKDALKELDIDTEDIARTAIRTSLKQIIRDGFFHADPHPSNFLISDDGKIIFLDFGMVGKLSKDSRKRMGLLLLHALNEDVDGTMHAFEDLAVIEDDADLEAFRADIENSIMQLKGSTISEESPAKVMFRLLKNSGNYGVHLPSQFVIMGKSLLTMEGIGLRICPDFPITDEFNDVVTDLLKQITNPKDIAQTFFVDMIDNQDLISRFPSKMNDLIEGLSQPRTTTVIEKSSGPSQNTLVAVALIIGASMLFMDTLTGQQILYLAIAEIIIAILLLRG